MRSTIKKVELRVTRVPLDERPEPYRRVVSSSHDVVALARPLLAGLEQEVMIVFHLDSRQRVLGYHEAGRGGVRSVYMTMSELLRTAILSGAAGVILAHNHPSGDPSPSREDVDFTARAVTVCRFIGMKLFDHVIVGSEGFSSLLDSGMLRIAEIEADEFKLDDDVVECSRCRRLTRFSTARSYREEFVGDCCWRDVLRSIGLAGERSE